MVQRVAILVVAAGISFLIGQTATASDQPLQPWPDDFFDTRLRPFLDQHCDDCHSGPLSEAGIDFEAYTSPDTVTENRDTWQRVHRMVATGQMPPDGAAQPEDEQRKAVADWIADQLAQLDCDGPVDPGRTTIRRLNRLHYANSVRDLFQVNFDATGILPPDDVGYGFDSIADVLSLPPLLMDKYMAAAEEIAWRVSVPELSDDDFLADAQNHLRTLMSRAYRRPVTDTEFGRLWRLVETARAEGASPEECYRLAVQAMLVSPHFLFRIERDPADAAPGEVRPLDDFELAVRLSYFLWGTTPDEQLFEAARTGRLHAELAAHAERLLADPRSGVFVADFTEQWLQLRNLRTFTPDAEQFPGFDDRLRDSMHEEAVRLVEAYLREDRPAVELLDADFTFVDRRLAKHYGLPGEFDDTFRRVSLAERHRGGVITLGGVLAVTSNPTRTSPVKRGKWIMENILGTSPPEPPPNVPMLPDDNGGPLTGTLRQRMEQHRADPNCAVCHKQMDPLGFALENFDPVGRWRTTDAGLPINATDQLPDGRRFSGPDEFRRMLKETAQREFVTCLIEKLMVYALGRGMEESDRCTLVQMTDELLETNGSLRDAVLAVVASEQFRKVRVAAGAREPQDDAPQPAGP